MSECATAKWWTARTWHRRIFFKKNSHHHLLVAASLSKLSIRVIRYGNNGIQLLWDHSSSVQAICFCMEKEINKIIKTNNKSRLRLKTPKQTRSKLTMANIESYCISMILIGDFYVNFNCFRTHQEFHDHRYYWKNKNKIKLKNKYEMKWYVCFFDCVCVCVWMYGPFADISNENDS